MPDFLGKLGSSLDKSLKTISAKGKGFVETAKLKSEIRDTEKAVEERFARLGREVYEMLNQGHIPEDDLRADTGEITGLYRKINELNETIRQVEAKAAKSRYGTETVICNGCRVPNRTNEKFCSACGTSLSEQAATTQTIKCTACGSMIKEGMKFCGTCGGKVG